MKINYNYDLILQEIERLILRPSFYAGSKIRIRDDKIFGSGIKISVRQHCL
jgi:hypothetical protein